MIEYPDVTPRVQPAVEVIEYTRNEASKGPISMEMVDNLTEEISDLRNYLMWVVSEYPETKKDILPVSLVIEWLLSVDETKH